MNVLTVDVAVNFNGSDELLELLNTDLQMIIFGYVSSIETLLTQWTTHVFLPQDVSYAGFAE